MKARTFFLSPTALRGWPILSPRIEKDRAKLTKSGHPTSPRLIDESSISNVFPLDPTGLTLKQVVQKRIALIEQAQQVPGYDDSFFVADLAQIERQHNLWQAHLPFVKPYYAVKCNSDPELLRRLLHLGVGFDCASLEEIRKLVQLGAHGADIIYANPCKAASGLRFAKNHGVQRTTFDNLDELDNIKDNHPNAKLLLRIFADDATAAVSLGAKYGAHTESTRALLDRARHLKLNVIGVSFHIGSGARDSNAMRKAVENARAVWSIADSLGFHMKILDIGGGFLSSEPEFRVMAEAAREAICYASFPQHTTVIGEPGRFYAKEVFTLVCRVIGRRTLEPGDSSHRAPEMLYQNDGVYGNFMNVLTENETFRPAFFIASSINKNGPRRDGPHEYSVWGPTCDSLDCVGQNAKFGCEVKTNDWLIYPNMGAYTSATATHFNGFASTNKVVYISMQSS